MSEHRPRSELSPELQGQIFETAFAELIKRLLVDDLRYDVGDVRAQTAGPQFGKDLLVRWRDLRGRKYRWAFECKSSRAPVPFSQVADKLAAMRMSGELVDVWCLVVADTHPSARAAELIAWARQDSGTAFGVEVLSPTEHNLKQLFACHPDLYCRVYSDTPSSLTRVARQQVLDALATWLLEATQWVTVAHLPAGWTRIEPSWSQQLPNDLRDARRFLRGFDEAPPWAAVVHNWAIPRRSVADPLVARLQLSKAGIDCCAVIAAGGEGKSTLLRQVAWRLAASGTDAVLFAERWSAPDSLPIPVDWFESLGAGSTVHLVVDDVLALGGLGTMLERRAEWISEGMRMTLLLAARQPRWLKADVKRVLTRATERELEVPLTPLDPSERRALVQHLFRQGLLQAFTLDQALEVAQSRAMTALPVGRGWLLPLMMQLTDREGRKFEDILASVLEELFQSDAHDSLRLLLAVSMAHATGRGLPSAAAAHLTRSSYATASATLLAELDRQLSHEVNPSHSVTVEDLYTHHQVIAEAFIAEALARPALRPVLLAVADELPRAIVPIVDERLLIPRAGFTVLDSIADYLLEMEMFELLERFYVAWIALDARQPAAWHRLGVCYSLWLAAMIESNPADSHMLAALVRQGRDAFAQSAKILPLVFADPATIPLVYRRQRVEDRLRVAHQAAGVFETRAFRALGTRTSYLRARLHGILALSDEVHTADGRATNTSALNVLAHAHMYADEAAECAKVAGTALTLALDRERLQPVLVWLKERDIHPTPDRGALVDVLLDIGTILLEEWDSLDMASDQAGIRRMLSQALSQVSYWLPGSERLSDLIVPLA